MPFVFVHGVNIRKNAAYEKEAGIRDGLLKDYVGPGLGIAKDSPVFAPYWGDTGVKFRKGLAVIPTGAEETFGAGRATLPPGVAELADQAGPTVEDRVQALAQKDPVKLADALFDTAMAVAPKDEDEVKGWCSPTPPHRTARVQRPVLAVAAVQLLERE